jgi:hypothetical protein
LDGVAVTPNRNVRIYHPASCQNSAISIKNVDGGAMITLISSTTPAKQHDDLFNRFDSEDAENVSDHDRPVDRGEYLTDQECPSSSSNSSTLQQHNLFFGKRPVTPLNLAALEEVNAAMSSTFS